MSDKRAKAPPKSLLDAAFQAFERGDLVTARTLAQAVLAGKAGPDEARAARELARGPLAKDVERAVEETPASVAAYLVHKTSIPGKTFWFALLGAGLFIFLLGLAAARGM